MQEIQRHYFHQKDGNIIRDEKDDKENIAGNSNDCTVGNSEITGVHGNSNELQMTTGVPQINIECDSPEEKGNADYTEGNIDNIGDSPENKGNSNHDEGNTNNNEGKGPSNTYDNRNSPSKNDKEYGNTHNMDDDDDDEISIEKGSTEDPQITINHISIIEEMNNAQINNN